ncbi:hypothetical protein SAMN05216339_11916, partial [Nitrosomonas eutropha]
GLVRMQRLGVVAPHSRITGANMEKIIYPGLSRDSHGITQIGRIVLDADQCRRLFLQFAVERRLSEKSTDCL